MQAGSNLSLGPEKAGCAYGLEMILYKPMKFFTLRNPIYCTILYVCLIVLLWPTTGCFGPDVAKALKAMGNDPATVHVRVSSVYGTLELVRTAPQGDSLAHTVAPDGAITVSRDGMPLLPGVADTNRTEQLRHLDGILNGKPAAKPPQ